MYKRKKKNNYISWIFALGVLRIVLVLIPQNGYIHPDEFFQSVEVLAGRLLNVEFATPWEFNTTNPIRGMTIPYFTSGVCLMLLRDMNGLAMEHLSLNLVTPYLILIVPRLLMTAFSFIVDWALWRICSANNEKFKTRLIVLATSYVILVYGTRTFSNSMELVLFSLLLYFVCESQTFNNDLIRKHEYIKYRYEKSSSIVERAKFHKLKLYLVFDNYRNCFFIATITVFGAFNRPTFICYALVPIFFWIYRGTAQRKLSVTQFHTRILFFAFCCIPAVLFNVIVDSFFYGYLTWGEIGMLEVSINNFVVTPFNFIKYNLNSSNLATHGMHPKYLHLLVNIPLLFNVLGVLAVYTIAKYIYWALRFKFHLLPSLRSIKMLMTMSFVAPVGLLSMVPHQEPRFLIPTLFPLIYLFGNKVFPEPANILVKTPVDISIQEKKKESRSLRYSKYQLLKFWLVFNGVLLVFYGFVHQGGILPAINRIHEDVTSSVNTNIHLFTSHMYSLPESFFLQSKKYPAIKKIHLYEQGSKPPTAVLEEIKRLVKSKAVLKYHLMRKMRYKLYLLIPSSKRRTMEIFLHGQNISTKRLDSFWPHLSMEAFPDITGYCLHPTFSFYNDCKVLSFSKYLQTIYHLCKLVLYELNFEMDKAIVITI